MSEKSEDKVSQKFDDIQAGLRHVSDLIIFMAAFELGERKGKGENVDAEVTQWRETLSKLEERRSS